MIIKTVNFNFITKGKKSISSFSVIQNIDMEKSKLREFFSVLPATFFYLGCKKTTKNYSLRIIQYNRNQNLSQDAILYAKPFTPLSSNRSFCRLQNAEQ